MPTLIYMRGPPGVGKSTIVRALQRKLQIPAIDYDNFKPALAPFVPPEELETVSYDMCNDSLATILSGDIDVIFDSAGLWKKQFEQCKSLPHVESIVVIECSCSDEALWEKRLATRTSKLTQVNKLSEAKRWFDLAENIEIAPLQLDTADTTARNVEKVITFLGQ